MKEKTKAVISAAVVLAVTVAAMFGVNLDGDALVNALLVIVDAAVVFYGCWKNHNFTDEAAIAQKYLDELKGK